MLAGREDYYCSYPFQARLQSGRGSQKCGKQLGDPYKSSMYFSAAWGNGLADRTPEPNDLPGVKGRGIKAFLVFA
jgi:hypothetical protein